MKKFNYRKYPHVKKYSKRNPFIISYTGAHGEANDLSTVVAASYLLKNLPIMIQLVGDGTEKNKLIKEAKHSNNIKFLDPLPKNEIPELLEKSHVILVSLADVNLFTYGVSPNKLYDAYAIGRPVITNIEGIIQREVTFNNVGEIAKAGNPNSLAIAIKKLFLTTSDKLEYMGKNARKLAEKKYSRELIIERYKRIISEIILKY